MGRRLGWGRFFSVVTLVLGLFSMLGCAPSVAVGGPPRRVEVRYVHGEVQGGVQRVPVGLGRTVVLVVASDVADEVHLHGYDRTADVPAGGSVQIEFVADRSGVFEVELESRGEQLVRLEVR